MVSLVLRTVKVIDLDVYVLCFEAMSTSEIFVRLEECLRLIIPPTGDAGIEDIDITAIDCSLPLSAARALYVFLDFCFSLT